MATVPGDPSNVAPMIPKWAQPTPADFLQAASIMDQKGKFQVAGDVVPSQEFFERRKAQDFTLPGLSKEDRTKATLNRALGVSNVLPIKPEDK